MPLNEALAAIVTQSYSCKTPSIGCKPNGGTRAGGLTPLLCGAESQHQVAYNQRSCHKISFYTSNLEDACHIEPRS